MVVTEEWVRFSLMVATVCDWVLSAGWFVQGTMMMLKMCLLWKIYIKVTLVTRLHSLILMTGNLPTKPYLMFDSYCYNYRHICFGGIH